ncbi:DUF5985 family protein [Lysobacter claricitrinus]|uniref:DUF5985 family protein n=1 Tax=Lysobacter claricitrinus TaxID=3367728 RepID=UPI0037DB90A8
MQLFLLGMISMGSAVAALLFVRFWRSGRDRLFLWFAAAFAWEACNRAIFAWQGARDEATTPYLIARLVFFALIIVAIVDKNLRARRPR